MDEMIQAMLAVFTPGTELFQITLLTLEMAFFSTTISMILGVPLGILVGLHEFRGKRLLLRILNTLMGLPPVLAGLIVFFILSRSGPLGTMRLLYTMPAMVIAQVIIITPIVCGITASTISGIYQRMHETARGCGMSRRRELLYLVYESRGQLISLVFLAFGRSIGEVGAVSLVGGNVQYQTRVMTTAIMLETNRGNFEYAVALGVTLLIISFVVNAIVLSVVERMGAPRRRKPAEESQREADETALSVEAVDVHEGAPMGEFDASRDGAEERVPGGGMNRALRGAPEGAIHSVKVGALENANGNTVDSANASVMGGAKNGAIKQASVLAEAEKHWIHHDKSFSWTLDDVKKSFNGRTVLNIHRLVLKSSHVYALVGPNGSGKTTLLRILSGLLEPTDGHADAPKGLRVGFLPQQSFAFGISVLRNVMLGIHDSTLTRDQAKARAHEALELVGMSHLSQERGSTLSGGETQRVALARLIVGDWDVVLLDEPTSAMDVRGAVAVEYILRDYSERTGVLFILSTHEPSQARRISDEAILLIDGTLVQQATIKEIIDHPATPEAREFMTYWAI